MSVEITDVSRWEDDLSTPQTVDFAKMLHAGIMGTYIKVSQANWLDCDYLINWKHAEDAGMPQGGFHFLDWTMPLVDQVRFFCGVLKNERGDITPALDYECRTGAPSNANARQQLHDGILEFEDKMGMSPVLYTGLDYWKNWGSIDPWWLRCKLWFAYPTDGSNPPAPPKPWTSWWLWQRTWTGDGIALGCESKGVDISRFYGTTAEYYAWIGGVPVIPPPATGKLFATVNVPVLNLRSGPGQGYTDIGDLFRYEKYEVLDVDGLNSWVKVTAYGKTGWIAVNINGTIYSLVEKEG